MYQGIVTTKKYAAVFVDGAWVPGTLLEEQTVTNSITATGMNGIVDGSMFGTGLIPRIHAYDHNEAITPAVHTVSGWLAEAAQLGGVTEVEDTVQNYVMKSITGRLDPTGVSRTIRTVGLAATGNTSTPAFAVRLTNPVVQGAAQIVDITYTLVARKANTITTSIAGGTVSKVSNNSWSTMFDLLYGHATVPYDPAEIATLSLLNTPDDFTTNTNVSGKNSLVENLGYDAANRHTVAIQPVLTQFYDEGSVEVEWTVGTGDLIGINFNKALMSVTDGPHIYVNDLGYEGATATWTAQNLYLHGVASTMPYPTLDEALGTGVGSMEVDVPTSGITAKFPVYVRAVIMNDGNAGVAEYFLQTRFTMGFVDNDAADEDIYRYPALDVMSAGVPQNTYEDGLAYTGRAILAGDAVSAANAGYPFNVFNLRQSSVSGSDYIGEANQSDAIAIVTKTSFAAVANLGTSVYLLNTATTPTFTPSLIRSVATVRVSNLARTFLADAATGLWRVNEVLAGETYSPGVPFQVAVASVDNTKCYAVASREIAGETVIFAAFEGGLARSLNGGTSWQVYSPTGLSFTQAGITDDWDAVSAIIPGPTNVGAGTSTIAVVLTDDTIHFIQMTNTGATSVDTVTVAGVAADATDVAFPVQKRCAYFKTPISAGMPADQVWVFGTATTLHFVNYNTTTGVTAGPTAVGADLTTTLVQTRFFEPTDATAAQYGLVLISTAAGGAVLYDGVTTQDLGTDYVADHNRLTNAVVKPYRHFYFTLAPSPILFNPFASADLFAGDAEHLVWRSYEWTGSEWQRYTADPVTVAPYPMDGRLVHLTAESIFSTGTNGILRDLPAGIELTFDDNSGVTAFIEDESFTFTLTSGIQKDEYTSLVHTASHCYYRSEPITDGTLALLTGPDMVDKHLTFMTRGTEQYWSSQLGVLSAATNATGRVTRSELVTPGTGQDISFKFKVTAATSTGTFAIGIAAEDVVIGDIGVATLADVLPIRIVFTGTTFQVFREGSSATATLGFTSGQEFTISTSGADFEIELDGTPVALSTATTIPAALTGVRIGAGAYALNNQNRYAYDMKVATWPASSGSMAYYKILSSAVDITADPLFISVESRVTPTSFIVDGVDITVETFVDPAEELGVASATDQIKLLPKSGIVLVNDVSSIGTASVTCVLLKK